MCVAHTVHGFFSFLFVCKLNGYSMKQSQAMLDLLFFVVVITTCETL